MVEDFRTILDDPGVDVLVNATPEHWHALSTVMACQAGKHVYVEKPLAHDIVEGRRMVEAARRHQRVVQVGTQTRSAPYVARAREYVQGGGLGEVRLVKVFNQMERPPGPGGRSDRPRGASTGTCGADRPRAPPTAPGGGGGTAGTSTAAGSSATPSTNSTWPG